MAVKADISGIGFILGVGVIYNTAEGRISGSYDTVGIADEDGDFQNIMPTTEDQPGVTWLEELGPGKLVFIPDDQERLK